MRSKSSSSPAADPAAGSAAGSAPGAAAEASVDHQAGASRTIWALTWRRFRKNRLAVAGGVILAVLYFIALFAQFFSAYHHDEFHVEFTFAPPQKVRFTDANGRLSRPFVYAYERSIDMTTLAISYREVPTARYPIRFFVRSEPYKLIGFIPMSIRLIGVDEGGTLFLWGTDNLGRDILSRVWTGAQVSLSVPLVGTFITILLGSILGVASAYFGRMVDNVIQRLIELLISFPQIPLWIALSAAVPVTWPSGFVYLGVVVILSLIGWGSLARVVRGKVLAYRQEEYVMAARVVGSSHWRIITRHLLPGSLSHIIVTATLAVPGTILGESSLSFLGIGITPPMTSWGVMLRDAQSVQALVNHLWLAAPGLMIVLTVLCFNFFGDGLRDAADPFAA